MKKIFLSLLALTALAVQAQVAYLLPTGATYNAETGELTGFVSEVINEVEQNPEYNAAEWFRATYVTGPRVLGSFMTPEDFVANHDGLKALWIHADRVMDLSREGAIDSAKVSMGWDSAFVATLRTFVAEGGNLLLTKQAAHLVGDIARAGYPEFNAGGYEKSNEQWFVATAFAERDNSAHHIYARHNGELGGDFKNLEMAWVKDHAGEGEHGGHDHDYNTCPDHNCGWGIGALAMDSTRDFEHLRAWEAANYARVLGTWGGCVDMPYAGFVEFLPYESEADTVRGTVLCLGLATYMWNTNNRGWGGDNVRHLTSCAVEYLLGPMGAEDGEQAGKLMEEVLEHDFFFPDSTTTFRTLHGSLENYEATYALAEADSAIAMIRDGVLVYKEAGTAHLTITLRVEGDFTRCAQGVYTYERAIAFSYQQPEGPTREDVHIDEDFTVDEQGTILLHPSVRGLDSVSYVVTMGDSLVERRLLTEGEEPHAVTRLVFVKNGTIRLSITLHQTDYIERWASRDYTYEIELEYHGLPEGVENVNVDANANANVRKVMVNGQLYILRDGRMYNTVGAITK